MKDIIGFSLVFATIYLVCGSYLSSTKLSYQFLSELCANIIDIKAAILLCVTIPNIMSNLAVFNQSYTSPYL